MHKAISAMGSKNFLTILAKPGLLTEDPNNPSVKRVDRVSFGSNVQIAIRLEAAGHRVLEWSVVNILFGSYDILHIHWPERVLSVRSKTLAIIRMLLLFGALTVIRLRGKKIVWTSHNTKSHDGFHPRLERIYQNCFSLFLNGVCVPLSSLEKPMRSVFRLPRSCRVKVIPFGNFSKLYECATNRAESRAALSLPLDARVCIHLGTMFSYKGLEDMCRVFSDPLLSDCILLLAGGCKDVDLWKAMEGYAKKSSNIRLVQGHVATEQVQYFMQAADLFVCNYDHIDNSATIRWPLGFGLPVLAPLFPFTQEYSERFGLYWLRLFEKKNLTPEIILKNLQISRDYNQIVPWGDCDWDIHVASLIRFYNELLQSPVSR